jgi:hypothetical protein
MEFRLCPAGDPVAVLKCLHFAGERLIWELRWVIGRFVPLMVNTSVRTNTLLA